MFAMTESKPGGEKTMNKVKSNGKRYASIATAAVLCLGVSVVPSLAMDACGTIPSVAPIDPNNALDSLPAEYKEGYNGYFNQLDASPWMDFKSDKSEGFKVAILWGPLDNDTQVAFVETAEGLLEGYDSVGEVVIRTASANDAVAQQVQQFNSLVADGVDAIIMQPLSSEAMVAPIETAAEAGVPTIVLLSPVTSLSAINVGANNFLAGAEVTAGVAKIMGGKGNMLTVHAIPGIQLDKDEFAGMEAVLSNCPDITTMGDLTGFFAPPVAKGEVLKWLATHGGTQIDGVFQAGGGMAGGIISAFQDAQLPVPPVAELGASKAHLGYWRQNRDTYDTVGAELVQSVLARASVSTALRVLQGQGLKISSIVGTLPVITSAELDDWADPSWDLNTAGSADGPADNPFLSEAFLDGVFTNGSTPK